MTGRLAQIRERFDAIIPGPWRWWGNTATDQVQGTADAQSRAARHLLDWEGVAQ